MSQPRREVNAAELLKLRVLASPSGAALRRVDRRVSPGSQLPAEWGRSESARSAYFQISFFRIRPDAQSDPAVLLKARRTILDSINMDRLDLAYEVISGASSGFYFLLAPLVSPQILDEARAAVPAYASGAEKEVRQIGAADNIARESRLLRVNPELSYVSDDFAGNERDFWN